MKIKCILFLSLILGLSIFSLVTNNYSQTKIKRNLKEYKEGPTLEDLDSRFGNQDEAWDHINNYVWELWNKKELAFFKVNSYTLEGRRSSAVYYVEKGGNGIWQLTVEWDLINNCPYSSPKKCEETRYKTFIFNKIEKVQIIGGKTEIIFHLFEKK